MTGENGLPGGTGSVVLGCAEFYQADIVTNDFVLPYVAPSTLTAFSIGVQYINTVGLGFGTDGLSQGTFFLPLAGIYIIDFEMSLSASGAIALYTGSVLSNLTIKIDSVSGATAGGSWIHGRSIVTFDGATYVIVAAVGPSVAATVVPAGPSNLPMTRITFLQLASGGSQSLR